VEIYLITNLINGKQYVGQTIHNKEKRWADHLLDANAKLRRPLAQEILKFGAQNFRLDTLVRVENPDYLDGLEQHFIRILETQNPDKGYNQNAGGFGNRKIRKKGVRRNSLTLEERLRRLTNRSD